MAGDDQFLYADRPRDAKGNADVYWVLEEPTAVQTVDFDEPAVVTVRKRICRCPKCKPKLPGLYKTPDGEAFGRGGRTNRPGEDGDKWADAPTDIELRRLMMVHGGLFRLQGGDAGLTFPVEFTEVKTPKIITLTGKQLNMPFLIGRREFADFIEHYRFRTDHAKVKVAFFWADKKVQVEQDKDSFRIKLVLTFEEGFRPAAGDKCRVILERRLDTAGNFHDIACLPDALTFGKLADYPELARYFGEPDFKIAGIPLFVDKTENLAVFRLSKENRESLRGWLDKPVVGSTNLGVNTREAALVLGLLLLWYIDEEYGEKVDEFFADPIGFIKAKLKEHVDSRRDEAVGELREEFKAYELRFKRMAYGKFLGQMEPETRKNWVTLRHKGKAVYLRAKGVMEIIEKIEAGLPVVMEGFRIYRFVESVLRNDTVYSSKEEHFFLSFALDPDTHVPNGVVSTNLIPIGFAGSIHSSLAAISNQLFFWESADAYYLSLLNVDKHVRNYTKFKAVADTEGKEVCFICGGERVALVVECNSTCSVCSQRYHRSCMKFELGDADCPRCLQRDVVVTE